MLAARFRPRYYAFVDVLPAVLDIAVGFDEQAKRGVVEFDQRAARHLAQAVLQVGYDRMRHEERAADLEQGGPLDGLDRAPVVAVAVAEIAEPAAAGPRLDVHRHGLAFTHFVVGAELLE